MLLGFLIPNEGSVFIDGKDITKISFASLRGHIGYVGQHPFLFNDTILANITYSRPKATMDEVIEACKAAHAH
jgi:ATP-binding cassette subfamily B protein/subfamily B ATP-binding cassette protein MsbA